MDYVFFSIIIGLIMVLLTLKRPKPLGFPGPKDLPILGCYFEVRGQRMHELMTDWARRFGPVFQYAVFGKRVVVVSHPKTIHEVLISKGKAFGGRPLNFRMACRTENFHNMIDTNNLAFNNTIRKLLNPAMKTYGTGRDKMTTILNSTVHNLLESFEKTYGQPFDPKDSVYRATALTLFLLVSGQRFETKQHNTMAKLLEETAHLTVEIRSLTVGNTLLDVAPWLRHLPWFTPYAAIVAFNQKRDEICDNLIRPLLERSQDAEDITIGRSLLDAVGQKFGKGQEAGKINMTHVRMVVMDLLFAGTLTTSGTMYALLNVLQHHQQIQEKAYKEIAKAVGKKLIEIDDKENLPYNRAVVFEILRYHSFSPVAVPHVTTGDTFLNGIEVPKGTEVTTNLWTCHHDPDLWTDPWSFRPERFLDDDGQLVPADHVNRKQLFPFGAGTRVCIGEVLALNRLLVFLANCLQKFKFVPPDDADPATCDARNYIFGSGMQPPAFETRAVLRQ